MKTWCRHVQNWQNFCPSLRSIHSIQLPTPLADFPAVFFLFLSWDTTDENPSKDKGRRLENAYFTDRLTVSKSETCQQCKQLITPCYLHHWWYFLGWGGVNTLALFFQPHSNGHIPGIIGLAGVGAGLVMIYQVKLCGIALCQEIVK